MIKSDARLKKLNSALGNNNKKLIIEAIELLRNEQPFEGAVGQLASLYDRTEENEILKAVEDFMNDLKDQSATTEVMAEIRHGWKLRTVKMLVASCWQSGLDYSSYTTDFAVTFLKGDFITAIECFTVIEEYAHELTRKERDKIIRLLEENKLSQADDKKVLISELISIVQG
jgi:hypothetical protein